MSNGKIGKGFAAFALGAAAAVAGVLLAGPRPRQASDGAKPEADSDTPRTGSPLGGTAAATGAEIDPRPATEANKVLGEAEAPRATPGQPNPAAEHVPTDLLGDKHPGAGDRAIEAFRPDPTAVPTAEEREALRPATGPAPSLVADRGSGFSEAAGAA